MPAPTTSPPATSITVSLKILAAVAMLFALERTAPIAAPVMLALVTGVVLAPLTGLWQRLGVPNVVSALASLLVTLGLIGVLALTLQPVVVQLIENSPKVLADVEYVLRGLRDQMQNLNDISEDVADAMQIGDGQGEDGTGPSDLPSVTDALLLAPSIFAQIVVFAGTLFFFLLTKDEIYAWLNKTTGAGPAPTAMSRLPRAEQRVSRYFLTITLINATLAIVTAIALKVIGLPGAMQWGLLAFFVNFVVYLGPAVFGISLLIAGIGAFDGLYALAPATAFVALNVLEGQFLTPALVGREMRINPLIVFVAVTFGLWLWGPIGGIVAIPILVWAIVLSGDDTPAPSPETKNVPATGG